MCMWLFIHDMHQFVIMNTWACEYAHLWWADSLWLCMHVHVIMPIYAMQSVCNYVCKSLSYATLCRAVILWLCMPVYVFMHTYAMQSVCNFASMSMWLCTHVHVIMHIYGTQSHFNSAGCLLICTRVHVSMHICCMWSAIDHPRYSCSCLSNFRDS